MYMVPQNYKVTDNMNDREYIDEGLRIVTPHDDEELEVPKEFRKQMEEDQPEEK